VLLAVFNGSAASWGRPVRALLPGLAGFAAVWKRAALLCHCPWPFHRVYGWVYYSSHPLVVRCAVRWLLCGGRDTHRHTPQGSGERVTLQTLGGDGTPGTEGGIALQAPGGTRWDLR